MSDYDSGGWVEWKQYVLQHVRTTTEAIRELTQELNTLRNEFDVFKARVLMVAVLVSFLGSSITTAVLRLVLVQLITGGNQ